MGAEAIANSMEAEKASTDTHMLIREADADATRVLAEKARPQGESRFESEVATFASASHRRSSAASLAPTVSPQSRTASAADPTPNDPAPASTAPEVTAAPAAPAVAPAPA